MLQTVGDSFLFGIFAAFRALPHTVNVSQLRFAESLLGFPRATAELLVKLVRSKTPTSGHKFLGMTERKKATMITSKWIKYLFRPKMKVTSSNGVRITTAVVAAATSADT